MERTNTTNNDLESAISSLYICSLYTSIIFSNQKQMYWKFFEKKTESANRLLFLNSVDRIAIKRFHTHKYIEMKKITDFYFR